MTDLSRRQFLKRSLAAGAALAFARFGRTAQAQDGEIPRRILGKTGESVTILGVGGAYVAADETTNTRAIVEAALDGGIRLFETARSYENSEKGLGPLLKGVRDEIFLSTKTAAHDAKQAEEDLHASLEALRTDHLDLVYMHGIGLSHMRDLDVMLGPGGVLEYLRKAKRDGLTRFIGMTVHAPHNYGRDLLERADDLDVAMPFINYLMPATLEEDKGDIIGPCRKAGLGLMAMKVLGGAGQLAEKYDLSFRYALSVPGVSCASIGMRNVEQVKRAIKAAKEFRQLTQDEMKQAEELGAEIVRERKGAFLQLQRHFDRDFGVA